MFCPAPSPLCHMKLHQTSRPTLAETHSSHQPDRILSTPRSEHSAVVLTLEGFDKVYEHLRCCYNRLTCQNPISSSRKHVQMFIHSRYIMNYSYYVPIFSLWDMKICVEQRIEKALRLSLGFQQLRNGVNSDLVSGPSCHFFLWL